MMIIESISWLSEEAKEAKLVITDGKYKCIAFSHPCDFQVNEILKWPLRAIDCINVMRSYEHTINITPTKKNGLGHKGVGRIIHVQTKLLAVGEILILLNNLPKDIIDGDFVEFECVRLDVKSYPPK